MMWNTLAGIFCTWKYTVRDILYPEILGNFLFWEYTVRNSLYREIHCQKFPVTGNTPSENYYWIWGTKIIF